MNKFCLVLVILLGALSFPLVGNAQSLYDVSVKADEIVIGTPISFQQGNHSTLTTFRIEQSVDGNAHGTVIIATTPELSHSAYLPLARRVLVFLTRTGGKADYVVTGAMSGVIRFVPSTKSELISTIREYRRIGEIQDLEERRTQLAQFDISILGYSPSPFLVGNALMDFPQISNVETRVTQAQVTQVALRASSWTNANGQKREIMQALGHINNPAVDDLLISSLREDHSRNVRQPIGWSLRYKERPSHVAEIAEIADDDAASDESVESAVFVLGEVGLPGANPTLRRLANSQRPPEVRAHALLALGKCKDHQSFGLLQSKLKDSDPGIRAAAAYGLARLDSQPAFNALKARRNAVGRGREKDMLNEILRVPMNPHPTTFTR